jgi:dihydroorotase
MSTTHLIKNARIVNEGRDYIGHVLIEGERISRIEEGIHPSPEMLNKSSSGKVTDATGKLLIPGVIDDQVHFREPGLTHKAEIYTESMAAVAGGITSYMEMPNTVPQTLTQELLEAKYDIAAQRSFANYSFFMGTSNDNAAEVLRTNPKSVCGIKIFLGASTGKMLVDDQATLHDIFSRSGMLIAVHSEHESTIQANMARYREQYGDEIPLRFHPLIRSEEACLKSTEMVMELASKYGTRLHVLHLSTAAEARLFENSLPLREKKITSEVCVHHLWFNEADYALRGNFIKWNPAVKTRADQEGLMEALTDNRIDIVATDHAPHTLEEKNQASYFKVPSGAPLVQHALPAMLEFWKEGKISLNRVVEKMCHAPADCYRIRERGYIREGYFADLVIVDPAESWVVDKSNILYKCGWSPMEGTLFSTRVTHTFVNGQPAFYNGHFDQALHGQRLEFEY